MTVVSRSLTAMTPAAPAAIAFSTMAFANFGTSDHFTTQTSSLPATTLSAGNCVGSGGPPRSRIGAVTGLPSCSPACCTTEVAYGRRMLPWPPRSVNST